MDLEEEGGENQITNSSKILHWHDGDQGSDWGRAAHGSKWKPGKHWGEGTIFEAQSPGKS